jgi:hypothetical protein
MVLAFEGSLTVSSGLGSLQAHAGQAVYVEDGAAWTLTAQGVAYVAWTRGPDPCRNV